MKFTIICVFLIISSFKGSESILSGNKIKIQDAPYMVWIEEITDRAKGLGEECGGSIIKDKVGSNGKRVSKFILTAAHCVVETESNEARGPENFYVLAGAANKVSPDKFLTVAAVHRHPDYNGPDTPHDIAVIELEEELVLDGKTKKAIKLAGENEKFNVGTEVLAAGWGQNPNATSQNYLYQTTMKIRSYKKCADEYGDNPDNPIDEDSLKEHQICALGNPPDYANVCKGDSGGPLVKKSNGVQIGLTSFGQDCFKRGNYPPYKVSVFTKISDNLDFINEHTQY